MLSYLLQAFRGNGQVRDARPGADERPRAHARDLSSAVLNSLWDKLQPHWNGYMASYGECTEEDLRASETKLATLRAWVEGQPDAAYRREALKWIKFYRKGIADARDELRTGRIRREREASFRRIDEKRARVSALSASLPRPD